MSDYSGLIDRLRVYPMPGKRPPIHGALRNEAADALEIAVALLQKIDCPQLPRPLRRRIATLCSALGQGVEGEAPVPPTEGVVRAEVVVNAGGRPGHGATVSATVVQYKPCEICTTQSWCETHGCQCYPISAPRAGHCNHFPGQVNCEWCTVAMCCVDYPRCDCNSPPEPDDDWLCFQRPAQPKVTP